MVKTVLELPGSVSEFLSYNAKCLVLSVMMKGGRLLNVTVELAPRYDCAGKLIPGEALQCPVCGVDL